MIRKVLCVCFGNSDRSPAMAEVLTSFLKNAEYTVCVESAGIGEPAKRGCASLFAITATKRIGLDGLAGHRRHHVESLDLHDYDLIVCASTDVATELITNYGVDPAKVYNAMINNPWPVQFQEDYDTTFVQILGSMYRVTARYFPNPA